MRRSKALFPAGLLLLLANGPGACSAGGGSQDSTIDPGTLPGGDGLIPGNNPPLVGTSGGLGVNGDDAPTVGVGGETVCDGLDDNGNGIIDDVDAGRDGLCDCLKIGFLGSFASDAGTATQAFQAWLEARSSVPIKNIPENTQLSAATLEGLQVLVVGNLSSRARSGGYTPAEVDVVRQWVEAGGGLMTLAGYTANADDMRATVQLLQPTGLGYDYQGRGPGVLGTGAPPVVVTGIIAHPTVEGITALGVYYAYPVTGDGEVIVNDSGFTLAMAKPFGNGRVFAFSDEWITQDRLWLPPPPNQNQTPCQQGCNQCANQTAQCLAQCDNCQQQPCQGGVTPAPGETCVRGCDQACTMCTTMTDTCRQTCEACSALEMKSVLDIPRFWLDVMRWLTPENECKVTIPPVVF
jgi:hypothetical protein